MMQFFTAPLPISDLFTFLVLDYRFCVMLGGDCV
jgi:hypothetical protein